MTSSRSKWIETFGFILGLGLGVVLHFLHAGLLPLIALPLGVFLMWLSFRLTEEEGLTRNDAAREWINATETSSSIEPRKPKAPAAKPPGIVPQSGRVPGFKSK